MIIDTTLNLIFVFSHLGCRGRRPVNRGISSVMYVFIKVFSILQKAASKKYSKNSNQIFIENLFLYIYFDDT